MQLILASASPRRKELLEQVGLSAVVIPSKIDESTISVPEPSLLPIELAQAKAQDVSQTVKQAERGSGEHLVIAADTVVILGSQVLGKPTDAQEAVQMLTSLQGKTHQVVTGVCLLVVSSGEIRTSAAWAETTNVTFRPLDRPEIEAYVATGEPMDKAGAYGIQGRAAAFVAKVDGCYTNVVGLPLGSLCDRLNQLGRGPWRNW